MFREAMARAAEKRHAIKALIGEHPDLRDRVVKAVGGGTFEQWSGYIPEPTITRGGMEVPNPSRERALLEEIADEARHRYAERMSGELPPC